jgi:chorismate mutase
LGCVIVQAVTFTKKEIEVKRKQIREKRRMEIEAERKNNEAENRKLLDFLAERMKTVDKEMKIKQKENAIIYKEAMLATLNEYLVLYPDTIRKAYIEKHIEEINKVIGECKKYLAGEIS